MAGVSRHLDRRSGTRLARDPVQGSPLALSHHRSTRRSSEIIMPLFNSLRDSQVVNKDVSVSLLTSMHRQFDGFTVHRVPHPRPAIECVPRLNAQHNTRHLVSCFQKEPQNSPDAVGCVVPQQPRHRLALLTPRYPSSVALHHFPLLDELDSPEMAIARKPSRLCSCRTSLFTKSSRKTLIRSA
jgi:hypothetical protein